ncbi:hypothetical protein K435DRAFT_869912 [Dendrothele bispora CBS 962.96]|uniref:F-box domain-containing protein n=1 Tax=Dendrothele bispora (strain CBS 962.96) TaxID=1314807 RepID=A0A4S8L7Y5_DENBC|nr:hypothetical protein K435DRAFT_869912 [Dendrothele bispora CBS 962.96]
MSTSSEYINTPRFDSSATTRVDVDAQSITTACASDAETAPRNVDGVAAMLSTLSEATRSRARSRPCFPFNHLFAYMELRDLVRIRRVSKNVQQLALEYIAAVFTYRKLLQNYFTPDELSPLHVIHSATNFLLTGTNVVEFLARQSMPPSDILEIFAPARTVETLITFLLSCGYTCDKYSWIQQTANYHEVLRPKTGSKTVQTRSMLAAYHESAVESVVLFRRDDSVISVTICPISPMYAILKQPTAAHTTVVTANRVVCVFPNALLHERYNFALRDACSDRSWVHGACRRYTTRGWPLKKLREALQTTCRELWPFDRHYMDDSCLALSLLGSVVPFPRTGSVESIEANEFTLVYREHENESIVEIRYHAHITQQLDAYTSGLGNIGHCNQRTLDDVIKNLNREHRVASRLRTLLITWMRETLEAQHWSVFVTVRPTPCMVALVMRYVFSLCISLPSVMPSLTLTFRQFRGNLFALLRVNLPILGRDGRCPVQFDKGFDDLLKKENIVVYHTYSRKMRHPERCPWPPRR